MNRELKPSLSKDLTLKWIETEKRNWQLIGPGLVVQKIYGEVRTALYLAEAILATRYGIRDRRGRGQSLGRFISVDTAKSTVEYFVRQSMPETVITIYEYEK